MEEGTITEQKKPYWEEIRELESNLFPEFKNEDYGYVTEGRDKAYYYFAPSHHFRDGLITEADIKGFVEDKQKQLLSIGSGPAYLEKLLTKLGIESDRIVISDVDPKDLPKGFKTKVFDMLGEWPRFEEKFELIIFPESVPLSEIFKKQEQRREGLLHIIESALKNLKQGGQIRMNGHSQIPENIEYVIKQLKERKKDVEVRYDRSLIVVDNK